MSNFALYCQQCTDSQLLHVLEKEDAGRKRDPDELRRRLQEVRDREDTKADLGDAIRGGLTRAFGENVLAELEARGFHRAPDADGDGFEVRSPLTDGLASKGFRIIRDLAHAAGLLDGTWDKGR